MTSTTITPSEPTGVLLIRFWSGATHLYTSSWKGDWVLLEQRLKDANVEFAHVAYNPQVPVGDIYIERWCDITEICRVLEIGVFK